MIVTVFWLSVLLVGYAYAGYPALTAFLSATRGLDVLTGDDTPPITVVISAYNEAPRIAARVADVLAQDYPADRIHVLVVSDGSTDATASAADIGDRRVQVLALSENVGKASAINTALGHVHTPIVCFTDVRQRYAQGALRALVAPFADASVGAVSGELMIDQADGSAGNVGLYWRMEKRLRHDEARLGWLHGVTGAVYALRRELYRPMPPGTVLDDMWVPLQVAFSGRRVWMARDAVAHDVASASAGEEFRRKLRTLAGNWQLIERMPQLCDPSHNPLLFAWISHKVLRLLAPWALLCAFVAAWFAGTSFYRALFMLQLAGYGAAAFALLRPKLARRVPLLPAAGTFVLLNFAALLSLPASLAWDSSRLWKKH